MGAQQDKTELKEWAPRPRRPELIGKSNKRAQDLLGGSERMPRGAVPADREGYAHLRAEGFDGTVTKNLAMTTALRVQAGAETARPTNQGEWTDTSQNLRSQKERAKEAGISRRTQQKLDALARKRPDLLDRARPRSRDPGRGAPGG
jgi:hypothetical protein